MSSLGDVFRELNALKAAGVVRDYALGGATAVLFYAEPTRTYDVDVFVLLPPTGGTPLAPLQPIYDWARARNFGIEAEHIFMHGVPVQLLPAHNRLAEEAVVAARTLEYASVPVRVIAPDHLIALALQVGGARQRERAWQLLESGTVDRQRLRGILAAHNIDIDIPDGPKA